MEIKTVLVVDDSELERRQVTQILEKAGYKILESSSGEDGVQKAVENTPDLIIMDVMMKGVTGFQATKHLKKTPETMNVPIIILSSREGSEDKKWGLQQGAICYIVKPASKELLLDEINKIIGHR